MAENRDAILGETIRLQFTEEDYSGAPPVFLKVCIIQDKEIIEQIDVSSIVVEAGYWEITVNTSLSIYRGGTYFDRWYLDESGSVYVDKTFILTDNTLNNSLLIHPKLNFYYSKDVSYSLTSDGDFDRRYNDDSIKNKVLSVINTIKGSLLMEPEHGTTIWRRLFSNNANVDMEISAELKYELEKQIAEIKIEKITADRSDDPGVVTVNIQYYIIPENTPQDLNNLETTISLNRGV